jgi:copper chaperone
MNTLKFKTSINCSGCVASVTPTLNTMEGIENWQVDVNDPRKVLEIQTKSVSDQEIVQKLASIGYKAELLKDVN